MTPRNEIEAMRKKSLVEATIVEIGRAGSLDVTVSQIAKQVGVSSALAHHYFGSKEQIFLAAMRQILTGFGRAVALETARSESPMERLDAIIKANFRIENFRQEIISAWLNFYVNAQNSPEARRLLRVYQRRQHSNLIHNLKPIVGDEAEDIALGLGAMIDGLYIRQALSNTKPDPDSAIATVSKYLEMRVHMAAPK